MESTIKVKLLSGWLYIRSFAFYRYCHSGEWEFNTVLEDKSNPNITKCLISTKKQGNFYLISETKFK